MPKRRGSVVMVVLSMFRSWLGVGLAVLAAAWLGGCDRSESVGRPPQSDAPAVQATASAGSPIAASASPLSAGSREDAAFELRVDASADAGGGQGGAVANAGTGQGGAAVDAEQRTPPRAVDAAQRTRDRWLRAHYPRVLELESVLRAHHEQHPERTRLVRLGRSVQGRPIWALAIGSSGEGRGQGAAVLLNGAHHGDEPLSAEMVLDAVDQLLEGADADPRTQRWLEQITLWCVPLVNPDGFAIFGQNFGAGRKNGRVGSVEGPARWRQGVDLNRNYPFRWGFLRGRGGKDDPEHRWYRGPAPASEPETRAMMRLAGSERFVASISYHAGTVAMLAPYTFDGVSSPQPNEAWRVAEDVLRATPPHPAGKMRLLRNLYPVDGTDQDWHRAEHGTVALLVETAHRSPPASGHRDSIARVVRRTWQLLLDRYLDGPSVYGFVRDANGKPLEAEVRIAEIATREGESWTSRCRDGRFDRYLPKPGRYTLQVPGFAAVERPFEAGPERIRLDY